MSLPGFYENHYPPACMHQWLTIETAPKDGTAILACNLNREYVPTTAYWAAYHPNATGKETWRTSQICGNKLDGLTHWMPLPPPPQGPSIEAK